MGDNNKGRINTTIKTFDLRSRDHVESDPTGDVPGGTGGRRARTGPTARRSSFPCLRNIVRSILTGS